MKKKFAASLRRLSRSLAESCLRRLHFAQAIRNETRGARNIAFEPLETRQLMASDFYEGAGLAAESSGLAGYLSNSGSEVSSASTPAILTSVAEGEPAPDLVAFAKSLRDAGVIFFGADWCPNCAAEKRLFEDGAQFLNFVEVTNPDHTANARGLAENVTTYPTWQFQNGSRQTGVLTLQQIATASGIAIPTSNTPSIAPITNSTVLRGSPLSIPVDAYDPNGNPLTITVTSSNPSAVSAEVLTGNQSARIRTTNFGDMVFELFSTEAPRPVQRFVDLANEGFYNTAGTSRMIFHRVIQNFVIQGGDPTGTGSGGSTRPDFDDQFNLNLQHNRTGVLSYAKSSDDTNDSQFFITATAARNLDFNHSIFGQLIEGDSTRAGIARTDVNANDKPNTDVVIESVSIFNDAENGLVRLRAIGAAGGTSTITVTATDSDGNQTSQSFIATVANDTSNGSPFLNDIPVISATAGQTATYQLTSQDKEGDTVRYTAALANGVVSPFTSSSVSVNQTTGLLTVTPPASFTGSFQVRVSVAQTTAANANDQNDTQLITVNVAAPAPSAPTSVDLATASDTGSSSSDNVTNAGSLSFAIAGTVSGATVTLKNGNTVLGTATATGTTTTITTANIASLGAGTYQLTATQTVNSIESTASPVLSVVFDNLPPAALSSNPFPTSVPAGQPLTIDLAHPDEGSNLTYSLDNAVAGMSINSSTGVFQWTPSTTQTGSNVFGLLVTDLAGNSRNVTYTITVTDTALGSINIQLLDSNDSPLTSVNVGQIFKVRLVARDIRNGAEGVFAAFADLNYNSDLVELSGTSPITYLNTFDTSPSGTMTTLGLINELGAARSTLTPGGAGAIAFVEVTFHAKASGQANFSVDAPESSGSDFLVYGQQTAVPLNRIAFGNAALAIGRNFTVIDDSFNFNEDSTSNILDALANDTVIPGTSTTISIVSVGTPSNGGTVTIASGNQSLRYTPAANFNGGETVTYTVRDNNGAEAIGTITIQVQPVNDPPIAGSDSYTFTAGSTDNFLDVLLNDNSGVDGGETLTVVSVGSPSQGSTARVNSGSNGILYTPRTGFTGTETLTYTLRDSNGGTATGTVNIQVNPAVPPPTLGVDQFTVTEDAAAAEFNVLANDTPNVSGRTLSITAVHAALGGTASVTSSGTRLTYSPRANFNGSEVVTYTVQEAGGGTAVGTVTFTVTAVNDPPDAVNDTKLVLSQPNQIIDVLLNDTNVDASEALNITSVTQPPAGQGTVSIQNNKLVYSAPDVSFQGTVTFTYTISDPSNATDTATVTLTVQNYTPRAISGNVTSGSSSNSQSSISGITFNVAGTALDGSSINRNITADLLGNFSVPNLAPGNYNFSVPNLPFIADTAQSQTVQSAINDGDRTGVTLPVGNIEASNISIFDFTSRNFNRGLFAAVSPGTSQKWVSAFGDWRNFRAVDVSMNTAGTSVTVRATSNNGSVTSGTVPLSNANQVSVRGSEGDSRLIRLTATPSEISMTPVTSSTSTSSTLSSSSSTAPTSDSSTPSTSNSTTSNSSTTTSSSSSGEGEGNSNVDLAMSQVSPQIEVSSQLAASLATSNQAANAIDYETVFASDLDEILKRRNV